MEAQLGLAPLPLVGGQPGDRVDLLVGVAALAEQAVHGLHGAGLDGGVSVQLERLADDIEEVLLDDPLGGEVLGEAADRGDLGGAWC